VNNRSGKASNCVIFTWISFWSIASVAISSMRPIDVPIFRERLAEWYSFASHFRLACFPPWKPFRDITFCCEIRYLRFKSRQMGIIQWWTWNPRSFLEIFRVNEYIKLKNKLRNATK
jgi:hypothetical protein